MITETKTINFQETENNNERKEMSLYPLIGVDFDYYYTKLGVSFLFMICFFIRLLSWL